MADTKKFIQGFAFSVAGGVASGLIVAYLRNEGIDFGLMKKQTKTI